MAQAKLSYVTENANGGRLSARMRVGIRSASKGESVALSKNGSEARDTLTFRNVMRVVALRLQDVRIF